MSSEQRTEPVLRASGVGKYYEIYERPSDRLRQTFFRGRRQYYRPFWAVRNVSFEVFPGQAVGLIGRNGSGKSTVLQMLAGTLRPSEGEMEVRGRLTALLELGAGFNPEFTGRENVYLNGAILGLSEAETKDRFDEIAAFADIGAFIDQPVKTYSSGMVVRLAFAVQVLLEPDVLLVDEALAVGDAAFQVKCISRMKHLLDRGVAVVLVTHDVQVVRSFCQHVVWLHEGGVRAEGPPLEVTSQYVRFLFGDGGSEPTPSPQPPAPSEGPGRQPLRVLAPAGDLVAGRTDLLRWGSGDVLIRAVSLCGSESGAQSIFEHGEVLRIEVELEVVGSVVGSELGVGFAFRNINGLDIITHTTYETGLRFDDALTTGARLRLAFEVDNILAPAAYSLVVNVERVRRGERHYHDFIENASVFRVVAQSPIFSLVLPRVAQHLLLAPAAEAHGTTRNTGF